MAAYVPCNPLTPFNAWLSYTPVIPKFYWNVYSQEERIKYLSMEWDRITHYLIEMCEKINVDSNAITQLQELFKEFQKHGFEKYYEEQINQWVLNNMPLIMEKALTVLFFGLTDDGYFCAYVPNNWAKYITFDTGAVYDNDDYGCLKLNY